MTHSYLQGEYKKYHPATFIDILLSVDLVETTLISSFSNIFKQNLVVQFIFYRFTVA